MDEETKHNIRELLNKLGPRVEYGLPEGWRTNFIKLVQGSDYSPTQIAAALDIPWVAVKNYIKNTADHELDELIKTNRAAYFERKLECPTEEDRKGHQLVKLGMDIFTDLTKEQTPALTVNQLDAIREERRQYMVDYNKANEAIRVLEQKRAADAEGS